MASVFERKSVMEVSVEGLEAAQRKLARVESEIDPRDGLATIMRVATGQLHRYIIGQPRSIMRVQTGRLKNSIFPDVRSAAGETVGLVATNVEYAPKIEKRYGFFRRGIENQRDAINSLFAEHVRKAL